MSADFRLCFFAETQVGIGSMGRTLRPFALAQRGARVTWVDVTYEGRLPLPGTAQGFLQTGAGLRRGPYDALLFLTHNPAVLRQRAVQRTPTCLWTDVTPLQYDRQAEAYGHAVSGGSLVRWLKHLAVRRTFQLARKCIGWSEWARRSFVEDYGVAPGRTAVVQPGVDLRLWTVPRRQPREGRPLRLLFVGGDFRRKGGPLLLEVLRARLRGRCEVDVVTREPVLAEEGVRVHRGLSAQDPALIALYQAADAFVLPTTADCHSVASLEAMATALPVVLTRVGANAEIVEHGASGFLIPPGEARELGDALEALAADPARARQMGERGRALVEAKFDGAKTAAQLFAHARGEA